MLSFSRVALREHQVAELASSAERQIRAQDSSSASEFFQLTGISSEKKVPKPMLF